MLSCSTSVVSNTGQTGESSTNFVPFLKPVSRVGFSHSLRSRKQVEQTWSPRQMFLYVTWSDFIYGSPHLLVRDQPADVGKSGCLPYTARHGHTGFYWMYINTVSTHSQNSPTPYQDPAMLGVGGCLLTSTRSLCARPSSGVWTNPEINNRRRQGERGLFQARQRRRDIAGRIVTLHADKRDL